MPGKGLAELSWRDVISSALFAVVIALGIRVFIIGVYTIPSHSMENTVLEGDNILVSKIAFLFGDVHRGDIIVFSLPDSLRGGEQDDLFIKRVIGLPGDTVRLTSTSVIINGERLAEPPQARLPANPLIGIGASYVEIIVPKASYFVLGDNRSNSFDSRYWGFLPAEHIVGAPLFVYWSFGASEENIIRHIRWNRIFQRIS